MALAHRCDAIVVIGSANSSNTRALQQLAIEEGCERVYRINGVAELPDNLTGTVGVTAGASAPEELVTEVVEFLQPARADLEEASAEENRATAKVRFLAELRNTVTPADAADEPQIEERRVAELWTFERTLGASDPNWVLARTEPAAA